MLLHRSERCRQSINAMRTVQSAIIASHTYNTPMESQ